MFLYIVGAVGLQWNLLSAMVVQRVRWDGVTSVAMTTYMICFSWFIFEYVSCIKECMYVMIVYILCML